MKYMRPEVRPALTGPGGLRHIVSGDPPESLCGAPLVGRSVDVWDALPESWRCPNCTRHDQGFHYN